jgi:hypothetical protein
MKKLSTVGACVVLFGFTWAVGVADANHNHPPSQAEIDFAVETSDLMTNTVVAALVQEIGETTPDNVAQGNLSIGLIFNDKNEDMRLVGKLQPLKNNDRPQDNFERTALDAAMQGNPYTRVERVKGDWYYRRSIPLSNFAPQCQMCHGNFASLPSTAWVGALMLRIPID